jgi:hypothetical protein
MSERRNRREERERQAQANELNDEVAGQGYEDTPGVDGHGIEGTVLDPRMGGKPVTAADVTPGPTAEPYPGTADAKRLREQHQRNLEAAERVDANPRPVDHRDFDAGKAYTGSDVNSAASGGPNDMLGTPAPGSNATPFPRPNERTATNRPFRDSDGGLDIGGQTNHNVNFPVPEEGTEASGDRGNG